MKIPRRLRLPPRLVGGVLAASLGCALLVAAWIESRASKPFAALDAPASKRSKHSNQEELASSLLMDSILSIIQSYYVDEERVDSRRLLDMALYRLTEDPEIKLRIDDSAYSLRYRGHAINMSIPPDFSYKELLNHAVKIASFLDKARPPKKRGTLWEHKGSFKFLNSMLASLDPHSALLDPNAYKELRQGTEGAFGGVGVVVGIRDNILTVIKPLPRSPAAKIGIHKYDRITRINEVNTYGISLDNLVEHMRGAPGTVVNLSLLRDGAVSPTDVSIKREVIQVDSVEPSLVQNKNIPLLHLSIESFASRTTKEVRDAIEAARRATGDKLGGIILDLRANPGGLLDQAVQLSDLFLRKGRIVSTIGRREEAENANMGYTEYDYPMILLINSESASASEIVAGALQDNNRALVIGQPSFGKGSVQTIFELPGEQALKLTIARYYTPRGRSIQNVGIMPHIWLQPVQASDKNLNLLGSNRYRSERFLVNHLDDAGKGANTDQWNLGPDFKVYYLQKDQDGLRPEDDVELGFAKDILSHVVKHYGTPVPPGARRASHWLALGADIIRKKLQAYEHETADFLKEKYAVEWKRTSLRRRSLETVSLEVPESVGNVVEGETVKVPFRITNEGKTTLERISIFSRSDADYVQTHEILIGQLAPGEAKEGIFEVPVFLGYQSDSLPLQFGIAMDAMPIAAPLRKISLPVEHTDKARLSGTIRLSKELNGHVRGALEAGEKSVLRVRVKNEGKIRASNVRVKIVNLAGKQVVVDEKPQVIKDLGPGSSAYLTFQLAGSKVIVTDHITLGLEIMGDQMADAVRQLHMISSVANGKPERLSNLVTQ